jgi:hypothetical protein
MNEVTCPRCGMRLRAPAPGTHAACPNCGQTFDTPDDRPPSARPARFADEEEPPRGGGQWPERERKGPRYADEVADRLAAGVPHSGLGIASFLIGLVVVLLNVLLVLIAVLMGRGRRTPEAVESVGLLLGVFFCTGVVGALVGLGLGVGGLFREDRNRTFAVVGVVLNLLVVLVATALFLIYLVLSGAR